VHSVLSVQAGDNQAKINLLFNQALTVQNLLSEYFLFQTRGIAAVKNH